MPRTLTQYRVFVGSPGGLQEERECFRTILEKFNRHHAEQRGVLFHAVGWEDTLTGVGRPQALINQDLRTCDYALFILHDRWGTPPGSGHTSGTEEEWKIAAELHKTATLRNIALLFKDVAPAQLKDPGDQLRKVLAFKEQIEAGKSYLFGRYDTTEAFAEKLEHHLSGWLLDHEKQGAAILSDGATISLSLPAGTIPASPSTLAGDVPGFAFWMAEARALSEASPQDHAATLYCTGKATALASSDIEWARARHLGGVAHFHLNQMDAALAAFTGIPDRLGSSTDADARTGHAHALVGKGVTLGALGRSEEEIAAYDTLLARFSDAPEAALREQVAKALRNKGFRLGTLGRSEEEIVVYDTLLVRCSDAPEAALREQVAKALFNKGITLGELGRSEEAIAAYDALLARFSGAPEEAIQAVVTLARQARGPVKRGRAKQ